MFVIEVLIFVFNLSIVLGFVLVIDYMLFIVSCYCDEFVEGSD